MTQQGNSDEMHVWWTIGQISERDKIGKPAVSRTVARLVATHGLPVERDGRNRVARVSLAHYDHLRSQFGSSEQIAAFPEIAGDTKVRAGALERGPDSRDEALRQEAWLRVGRAKLEHQEEVGQLVRADKIREAMVALGRHIQSEIMRLPNHADDLALAVGREGTSGLRMALKLQATKLCEAIASRLDVVAAGAPESDEFLDEGENGGKPPAGEDE